MAEIFTISLIWSTIRLIDSLDPGGPGRNVFGAIGGHQHRSRRDDAGRSIHRRRSDLCGWQSFCWTVGWDGQLEC